MNCVKKVPVVKRCGQGAAAAAVAAVWPSQVTIGLDGIAGAIRDGLMAFSCSAGMMVIGQIMAEEMTAKVGVRGRHDPDRVATRNGTASGSVVLGGRMVPGGASASDTHDGRGVAAGLLCGVLVHGSAHPVGGGAGAGRGSDSPPCRCGRTDRGRS